MGNIYPELPRTLPVTFSVTAFFMDAFCVNVLAIDMVQFLHKIWPDYHAKKPYHHGLWYSVAANLWCRMMSPFHSLFTEMMRMGVTKCSPLLFLFWIFCTTSIPDFTMPKAAYPKPSEFPLLLLLPNCCWSPMQMKNSEEAEPAVVLAIEMVPLRCDRPVCLGDSCSIRLVVVDAL